MTIVAPTKIVQWEMSMISRGHGKSKGEEETELRRRWCKGVDAGALGKFLSKFLITYGDRHGQLMNGMRRLSGYH